MIEIINRIKKAYGFQTDAEVARFLDLKPNTLAMQKSRGTLDLERVIEQCHDLNKNWLFHGVGPVRLHQSSNHTTYSRYDYYDIPLYQKLTLNIDGKPKPVDDNIHALAIPVYFIDGELHETPDNLFATRVTNDSMAPTFHKGDLIIVNKSIRDPVNGSIFMVRINDEIDCKRIQSLPGKRYKIISDNDSYTSYEIDPNADGFGIVGRIEWMGHKF